MALVDSDYLAQLPIQLRGKLPAEDPLTALIDVASEQVENYCKRKLELGAVVEQVRGMNTSRLVLREWPVATVDSIDWLDDDGKTGTVDLQFISFGTDGIVLMRDYLNWFYDYRVFNVHYTAGYDPIPAAVKHAAALQTIELAQSNTGVSPLAAGGTPVVQTVVDLLEDYRRKGA